MGNVLVIEDDADTAGVLFALARELKCHVTSVSACDEALQTMAGRRFDLVVLDNQLPGMSGIELLCVLRSRPFAFPIPPIVVFSADDAKRLSAIHAGAAGFILKGRTDALLALAEMLERYAGGSHY